MPHFPARIASGNSLTPRSCCIGWTTLALAFVAGVSAAPPEAQWSYRAPNLPRTATGAANVRAPAPRTQDGRVDLSDIWQTDAKYNFNLAADLKPEDVPMLPTARTIVAESLGPMPDPLRGTRTAVCRWSTWRTRVATPP